MSKIVSLFVILSSSLLMADPPPSMVLAWSEYTSWSSFGVAHEVGLINGEKDKMGEIEKKYNVDIVLKLADYDTTITMYGSGNADAVCITNMDILAPSLSRSSVAILPTSTSRGADALIVTNNIKSIKDLKKTDSRPAIPVYGLSSSVSEYMFIRCLETINENPSDYEFKSLPPDSAATKMQQKDTKTEAIVVWNPFVIQTLNQRKDVRVLLDSSSIPNEIIDMVVVAESSLERQGGDRFACAVIETYYRINNRLKDPATGDDTLIALGEKFANLTLKNMRLAVRQSPFYETPDQGIEHLIGSNMKSIMPRIASFCQQHGMIPQDKQPPVISYGQKSNTKANLRFDSSYIEAVKAKM